MTQVGILLVALTTLLTFAVGTGLLALAVRRSRRWVRALLVAAALFAVVSAGAPLSAAQDTATGVLLATMHLVTGAAFLVTAWRVRTPMNWRLATTGILAFSGTAAARITGQGGWVGPCAPRYGRPERNCCAGVHASHRSGSGSHRGERLASQGKSSRSPSAPVIRSASVRPARFAVATPSPTYPPAYAQPLCRS